MNYVPRPTLNRRSRLRWLYGMLCILLLSACATSLTPPQTDTLFSPEGCVTTYDPTQDYFPAKAQLSASMGWTISYHKHYKVISVLTPWQDAEETFQYVLVQCGTPVPDGFDTAQIIEVPIATLITMSSTYLPHLAALDLEDRLVGVDNPQYINDPDVLAMIAAGNVATVGSGATVDVERILELEPSLVMTYGTGNPDSDAHPQLLAAGVPVAINAEYMETSPLGRAEWIKFTAAFFNREADAETIFAEIDRKYKELAALASTAKQRPTLFANAPYQDTWYMPGGKSYPAQLFADAGATYLWADDPTQGSLMLSLEAVLDKALDADVWVHPGMATTLAELQASDERFAQFAAFRNGAVYNNNKRLNPYGGNDYWESGVTNPHLLLADLIAILHPELLPDHELYYYQQLR